MKATLRILATLACITTDGQAQVIEASDDLSDTNAWTSILQDKASPQTVASAPSTDSPTFFRVVEP